MTEPFEDIVRDALRGTSGAADEMPTYHGAWQRGRRRRLIKRSALVATGAFVLLAALTVNLGRIPGSEPIETSDVATGAAAAVAATPIFEPTTLETTAPVETPSLSDGDTDSVPAAPTAPTASVVSPAETPTAVPQAAEPPAAVAQTTLPQTAVPQTGSAPNRSAHNGASHECANHTCSDTRGAVVDAAPNSRGSVNRGSSDGPGTGRSWWDRRTVGSSPGGVHDGRTGGRCAPEWRCQGSGLTL